MNESEDPDWVTQWDDVVDVICVGSNPGVLAYGNACSAADLDVLHIASPAEFDAETSFYLAAMTEGLDIRTPESEPAVTNAVPAPPRRDARGRPDVLDPFFGEQLREWSSVCMASPFAVVFTQVPDQFTRMRSDAGEIITVMTVPDSAEMGSATDMFAGLIYEEGRLAGALITGRSGERRVRAGAGLALPIGPAGQWPRQGSLALVSRPAGRFARLEVVLEGPGGDD